MSLNRQGDSRPTLPTATDMKRLSVILIACFAFVTPIHAGDDAAKKTIAYVRALQTKDGGFLMQSPTPGKTGKPSLRATSSALRAVRYFGGALKDKDACAKFVASRYDPITGGFSDSPKGKPAVFDTA